MQMLTIVPPAHWEQRFAAKPSQLAAAARDEWSMAVLEGWSRAAILHRDSNWALALWERWHAVDPQNSYYSHVASNMLTALVALLPQTAAETLVRRMMREGKDFEPRSWQLILSSIPRPWSAEMAKAYIGALQSEARKDRAKSGPASITWWFAPDAAAQALPPQYLREVQDLWTEDELREADWRLRTFIETLQIREQIWKEIPA
jgi:hypothetical protein